MNDKAKIAALRAALEISQKALDCLGAGKNTREFAMTNAAETLALTADDAEQVPELRSVAGKIRSLDPVEFAAPIAAEPAPVGYTCIDTPRYLQDALDEGFPTSMRVYNRSDADRNITLPLYTAPGALVATPDLSDALSAVMWLYHRLPRGYERQSHIERVVRSLATATGSDGELLLRELWREGAPVADTETVELCDAQVVAIWDRLRKFHGGEPCKLGHIHFARNIQYAIRDQSAAPATPTATADSAPLAHITKDGKTLLFGDSAHTVKDQSTLIPLCPCKADSPADACEWTLTDDDNGIWESSCGEAWSFIDGGPKENRVSFCHHCGKPAHIAAMHPTTGGK